MAIHIAIPCFDEDKRLDERGLDVLLTNHDVHLVLVDDGSRDATLARLRRYASEHPARVRVVALAKNGGKAEAVRAGLQAGVDAGAAIVGYLDADLATPPSEMLRIVDVLHADPHKVAALGARIARLGARIERRAWRHYFGRVFATAASELLGVAVYDTQCGAKAFRVDDVLRVALSTPFTTTWIFDVELLQRVLGDDRAARAARIVEVPLLEWRDVGGSKVKPTDVVTAATQLARLAAKSRRR